MLLPYPYTDFNSTFNCKDSKDLSYFFLFAFRIKIYNYSTIITDRQ